MEKIAADKPDIAQRLKSMIEALKKPQLDPRPEAQQAK